MYNCDKLQCPLIEQLCRSPSSLLPGRNIRWLRRMLPPEESRWVWRRDRQTDGRTDWCQTVTLRFLLVAASAWYDNFTYVEVVHCLGICTLHRRLWYKSCDDCSATDVVARRHRSLAGESARRCDHGERTDAHTMDCRDWHCRCHWADSCLIQGVPRLTGQNCLFLSLCIDRQYHRVHSVDIKSPLLMLKSVWGHSN